MMRGVSGFTALALTATLLASPAASANTDFDHDHTVWNELLRRYVRNDGAITDVDYAGLSRARSELERYHGLLSEVTPAQYDSWSADKRLAFLINAYNAFTVGLIIDNDPVDSIKDLGGWFSSPWKKRFFDLLGARRHLDDIEHGMIRRQFREPRIHFAVNCAARGCPPLRAEAYVPHRLDTQLEENARIFLNDPRRNRLDIERSVLEISAVMKWYREDFEDVYGSLEAFLAPRMTRDPAVAAAIRTGGLRLRVLDYDWSLNGT
jgi:hypothetical protein